MENFWQNYWWIIVVAGVILLIIIYILIRFFIIFHLDYKWERNLHFPQWTNNGIITRDNYLLSTSYKFVENSEYIIIGVHGMGASLTDFKTASKFFTKNGFSFLSFNQRGWGKNEKWKYHSLGTNISDIKDIITVLNEHYPNQKIILLGESLGSALTALAIKKLPNLIHSAIITNFVTKKQIFKLTPKLVFQAIWGFMFCKNYPLSITFNMEEISNNKVYISQGTARALSNMKFSVLFSLQAQKLSKQVPKNVNAAKCPVLIVQSKGDVFADFDQIEINNKKWRTGVTYKFYNEGKHAILNESNIITILEDAKNWINNN